MVDSEIFLCVIIPANNEAERLPRTLRRFHEYLTTSGFTYEILVLLVGPSDRTREVLQKLVYQIPHLPIIDRPVNRKGCTVKEGMLKAVGRVRPLVTPIIAPISGISRR